jgi:ribosomal protein S18 acetylase RimI-like enzyme
VGDREVRIRPATRADAPRIAAAHVAAWRESYGGLVPEAMLASLSVEERTALWSRVLGEPRSPVATVVYVAERGDEIVGFGSCGAQLTGTLKDQGYDAEISAIYVLRAFQRCGLGSGLLHAMAVNVADRGFKGLGLWVLCDNAPARRFYERNGGEVVGEREEVRENGALLEVAYGWADLPALRRATADRGMR